MANKGKCIVCQSKAEPVKVKRSRQKENKFAIRGRKIARKVENCIEHNKGEQEYGPL